MPVIVIKYLLQTAPRQLFQREMVRSLNSVPKRGLKEIWYIAQIGCDEPIPSRSATLLA